ncbi:DUF3857 domain-containing protein [Vibrio navarrensis]|uniref:DUF3857 domain-containing protein n=1 Tax=Vibrio navarrensis TaxID=29495 RepID=A0AAI9CVD9_9VIBR|nr:DUF3857 domain-containing protein [Vibrio navarrensis]EGR2796699.1 DUF3857 domain-containing protein [Vibrio navarrensis]EJL6394394.1 DUF3857 domain-containing protein [Vibrio navarrensis]EKA5636467.1 DUF3857 domain-containing protein [Vibrio navarrensis]ELN6933119.1 DUF3857 domain-containing protein [Vibrio navarrensis]
MKFIWTVWLYALVSFSLFASENITFTPIPDWVSSQTFVEKVDRRDRVDGSIYLLVDRQYNFALATPSFYSHYATQVVNSKGVEEKSQISVSFDPLYETVNFHHLVVWRDGKRIDKSKEVDVKRFKQEADLEKLLYNGTETYYLVLKNVEVGDIIDYSFSVEGVNPVFDNIDTWIKVGWSVPVAKTYIRNLVPENKGFTVTRTGNTEHGTFTHNKANGVEEYVFEDFKRRYDYDEAKQPSWYSPYPHLNISNYQNWQSVVQWALPLFKVDSQGERLANELKQLNTIADKEEQIMAAIKLAQQKVRYLGIENGIGSHAPRHPEQVLSQGYGDCKDKTLLLVTLLRQLGIEANPALVSTTYRTALNEQLPGHSAFNHVIVNFTYQGEEYWIDPTSTEQGDSLDTIVQSDLGYALIINEKSSALSKIRVNTTNKITSSAEFNFKYRKDGASSMKITTVYEGRQAERIRHYLTSNSLDTVMGDYEDYYSQFYPSVYVAEDFEYQDDSNNNMITMVEKYVLEAPWIDDEEDKIRVEVTADIVRDFLSLPKVQNRKTPYYLGRPIIVEQDIIVNLPKHIWVEEEKATFDNKIYSMKVSIQGDRGSSPKVLPHYKKVAIRYFYQRKADQVMPHDMQEYFKTTNQVMEHMTYYFTYQN